MPEATTTTLNRAGACQRNLKTVRQAQKLKLTQHNFAENVVHFDKRELRCFKSLQSSRQEALSNK